MENKTLEFLNTIGINEDYLDYFKDSYVEKVSINKQTNRFHFILNINNILPINVYEDLLESLKESFHHEITLTINYNTNNYTNIEEYINKIINNYTKEELRYAVFKDRQIEINDQTILFPVYNKIEAININSIKKDTFYAYLLLNIEI